MTADDAEVARSIDSSNFVLTAVEIDHLRWRQRLPDGRRRIANPTIGSEDEDFTYWTRTIVGTSTAGMVYGFPFFIIGSLFGLCIAAFYSVLLAVPCAVCVRTLTGKWRHPLAGPAFGGLVGFVSTYSVWSALWDGAVIIFILGPMTTTLFGQIGGYWINRDYFVHVAFQRWLRGEKPKRWQFSVRDAMVATAWVAVSLAAARTFGMGWEHGLAIAVWLPWQLLLLAVWSSKLRKLTAPRGTKSKAAALHVEHSIHRVTAKRGDSPNRST